DRHRIAREMADDALVEPLEPRGEKRELGFLRELLDERLVEKPPLRRQRHDPCRAAAAVRGLERRVDDVDAQHHPGTAAVRVVVDLARAQRRRVAVVEEPELELRAENRREGPLLGEPAKGMRDLREDVDAHGGPGYPARRRSNAAARDVTPSSRISSGAEEAAYDDDPSSREIDGADGVVDQRYQRAVRELEVVVGDPRMPADDESELRALLVHHGESDELERVVAVRFREWELGDVNRELRTALDPSVEPDRAPAAADAPRQLYRRRGSVDQHGGADLPPTLVVTRALDDEGSVQPVWP